MITRFHQYLKVFFVISVANNVISPLCLLLSLPKFTDYFIFQFLGLSFIQLPFHLGMTGYIYDGVHHTLLLESWRYTRWNISFSLLGHTV